MTDSPPDKSSKRENSTPTPHSFLFSTTTLAVTLIRIGFLVPKEWLPFQTTTTGRTIGWLQFLNNKDMAPFWTSTLIRPHETWDHVREAQALRHLMGDQFRDAYRGSSVHVPPLVLAFCETILGLTPSQPLQSFVIGVGTHLMDLAIAITLLKLGNCVLKELREYPWEEEMQLRVPESLRPPLTSVFPISEHAVTYTDELPPRIALEEEKPGQSTEVNNEEQSKETIEDRLPPSFSWSGLPLLAAKLYYYCPITALASGLGSTHQSFQNLWLFLLLQSLHQGCGSPRIVPLSAFCLAMASYSELHFVVYLIPISLWLKRQKNSRSEVASKFLHQCLQQGVSFAVTYIVCLSSTLGVLFLLGGLFARTDAVACRTITIHGRTPIEFWTHVDMEESPPQPIRAVVSKYGALRTIQDVFLDPDWGLSLPTGHPFDNSSFPLPHGVGELVD